MDKFLFIEYVDDNAFPVRCLIRLSDLDKFLDSFESEAMLRITKLTLQTFK